jgi:signal transduction histidine kinase
LRVVLTFIAIVAIGSGVSYLTSSHNFRHDFTFRIQGEMLRTGREIVQMYSELAPMDPRQFLDHVGHLRNVHLSLYEGHEEIRSALPERGPSDRFAVPQEAIDQVVAGRMYRSPHVDDDTDPSQIMVGLPLPGVDGRMYSLFIMPNFPEQSRQFRQGLDASLITFIIIGSLLILAASRYLVKPLRTLMEATNQLARGNFEVRVNVRRNDEIGQLAGSFNHMADELQQLEQMRQDFVSNVSHEIQTPLTSIRGFSKALQEGLVSEDDRQRYLKIIEQESERLSRLGENLLKLASLESDHHPLDFRPLALDEQIRQVVLANEPLWSEKQLDIHLELPKTTIVADKDSLSQVWTNILHNAIKFTPDGGRIRIAITAATGHQIQVDVSDTGTGMAEEHLRLIFQRFYKADRSRQSRDSSGSGLGLSIAKRIIDLHKGEITAESAVGRGTTVRVTLPTGK